MSHITVSVSLNGLSAKLIGSSIGTDFYCKKRNNHCTQSYLLMENSHNYVLYIVHTRNGVRCTNSGSFSSSA